MSQARALYDLLLRPVRAPGGAGQSRDAGGDSGRRVTPHPLAALHDGERFVIAKYAIAYGARVTITSAFSRRRASRKVRRPGCPSRFWW